MTNTINATEVPVKIVGSSIFGRYPFISGERTYNMFISDDYLVNFAGYEFALEIVETATNGRGLFHSIRGNFLLAVVGANVYRINDNFAAPTLIDTIATNAGEVFMDENLSSQIGIVDGENLYIYNYFTGSFGLADVTFDGITPNYITYQNTYFIIGNSSTTDTGNMWGVYESGFVLPATNPLRLIEKTRLALQTKPDFAIAALRIPGKGNNLLVLGTTVAEIWSNVGGSEVYRRNSSLNIDYGCISVSTIASSDEIIAWLSINEKSAPSIIYMAGGNAERISTDGIDFLLANIVRPDQSTALFYRQDGHLFYQLTFYNEADNLTVVYDFTTQKFYDLTDTEFNYHPARQMVYFEGDIYFISLNNGNLYRMGSEITTYETTNNLQTTIPRIRVCDTFRGATPEKFRVQQFSFTIENGVEPLENLTGNCTGYILNEETNLPIYTEDGLPLMVEGSYCGDYWPRIDIRFSKNGARTFGSSIPYYMHSTGHYKNQPRFNRLGGCNMFTVQMRFYGFDRFIASNGMLELSQ